MVGTAYPIFLEVINNSKISVGPPFYHKLIIPFLIPFLFFMALGPNLKWIKNEKKTLNFLQLIIFCICLIVSYLIILKTDTNFLFSTLLFTFSFYLFFQVLKSFSEKKSTYSQKISHFGFSLFLISILFNGILSKENSANMKVGDEMNFLNKKIIFENVQIKDGPNYRTLIGEV